MKIGIKLFLIVFFFSSCKAQKSRVETKIQDCYNSHYTKSGNDIKKTIIEFEKILISKKLLKSNKGKDYIELLKKIERNEITELKISFKELDNMNSIRGKFSTEIYKCQQAVFNSKIYDTTTFDKLRIKIDSLVTLNQISSSSFAKSLLSTITTKDTKLDYYKLMVFRILNDYSFDLNNRFPTNLLKNKKTYQKEKYKNPFEIALNEKNEISVNGKIILVNQFKELIKIYEQKEKENSAIIFIANRKTTYKFYTDILDIINSGITELRKEYSKKEYNKEFENLEKTDKLMIEQKYPIRIIENEIKD